MFLRVCQHLQSVLEAAQKHVGRAQFFHDIAGQKASTLQDRQRREDRLRLQALVPPSADQLKRLNDELDLADSSRTELHVVGQLAPLHLSLDEAFHLAQTFEHAVIEVASEDERAHGGRIERRVTLRCSHRSCFDVCIPLPVTAVTREVVLERGETRHEGSAISEGPQAHVDA